jgi:hypothetical protein
MGNFSTNLYITPGLTESNAHIFINFAPIIELMPFFRSYLIEAYVSDAPCSRCNATSDSWKRRQNPRPDLTRKHSAAIRRAGFAFVDPWAPLLDKEGRPQQIAAGRVSCPVAHLDNLTNREPRVPFWV